MYQSTATTIEILKAHAAALAADEATAINAPTMGTAAIEWAVRGWAVGPLCHRDRATGRMLHHQGKEPVGRLVPRGVKDFTTDIDTVARWWSERQWNIGIRPPESVFVLDIDPQHGGHATIAALERQHEPLPETFGTVTGRGWGSRHLYFRRPPVKLTSKLLPGCDIKDHNGYLVAAPSIHPETRKPYCRIDGPIADPPEWLLQLIRVMVPAAAPVSPRPVRRLFTDYFGPSIAETYCRNHSWTDVLGPHGWSCRDGDPDADGARWVHPTATSAHSATIRGGQLYVYSPNTAFDITESSDPHGYSKFSAYAVLNHRGDMKAAARALRLTERL